MTTRRLMRRILLWLLGVFMLAFTLAGGTARAASVNIAAGKTLELSENLVLSGTDNLVAEGTAGQPCTIIGNKRQILTDAKWTGHVRLKYLVAKGLGEKAEELSPNRLGPEHHALSLLGSGAAEIVIENCTFDACSSIHIVNNDTSTTVFRNNLVQENSTVNVSKDAGSSRPVFQAEGNSPGKKLFQGNRVFRSSCQFNSPNWLVGGETDAESNIVSGVRGGMAIMGRKSLCRNNYLRLYMLYNDEFPYWSQTSTFTAGADTLVEYNVIRDSAWVVQFIEGEFRYNLISDSIDHDSCRNGSTGVLHHNIFFGCDAHHYASSQGGNLYVVYPPKEPGGGLVAYNNVFDGCDRMACPAVEITDKGFVKSLRNNVFVRFKHTDKYGTGNPPAVVRYAWDEKLPAGQTPSGRLGYADYNCFFNPQSKIIDNYALAVAGKTERKDAGFALNDLPKGGKVDEQCDPRFKGPLPLEFPYKDEDVKTGKVTVSQILKFFREAYTPAEGSPLLQAGDPADGQGTDIGAVRVSPVKAGE